VKRRAGAAKRRRNAWGTVAARSAGIRGTWFALGGAGRTYPFHFQNFERGTPIMAGKTFEDMLIDETKDIYDAEKRLTKALPKMAKAATTDVLREAFEDHLAETKKHVERLEKIFKLLEKPARGKKCAAMAGLVEEGGKLIREKREMDGAVFDAALIAAAQKVEHYEIASYGTLATWAEMLGLEEVSDLFEESLAEEKAADDKLTSIAAEINVMAQASEE
jgi:ferritin-like metal-binding protein YciE